MHLSLIFFQLNLKLKGFYSHLKSNKSSLTVIIVKKHVEKGQFGISCYFFFPFPELSLKLAVSKMHHEEMSAREEFTYSHMSTLERGSGTLGRRGDRGSDRRPDRPERDSYTVDVRASDLQLAQPEPLKHPCFSYRAWLYSVLIGVRGKGKGELKGRHITGFTSSVTH